MKLEASHYDVVEWNPELIKPGKIFYKPEKIYNTKIGEKKEIIFRSPCRIDVGLIDYSALKFTSENDYKAGEMSFAGDIYTWARVKLTDSPEIIIKSERKVFVEHYAKIIRQVTDYKGGFEIETKSHNFRHVGFGSSAIMGETVAYAINELLGNPLTFRELRKIVVYNFVEESDTEKGKLFPGASTGGSFNTIKEGGFVITSTEAEKIFHEKIPEGAYFIVGTPNVQVAGPEASETDVNIMGWERHNERVNAAKACLWILMEIMPRWVAGKYKEAGEAFYNYTLFGGKAMQMLFYRCDLAGILFELKEAGLEGGWMTSAGPSLVAFTLDERKREKAINIFKNRKCKNITVVRPDNEGIKEFDSIK